MATQHPSLPRWGRSVSWVGVVTAGFTALCCLGVSGVAGVEMLS